MHENSFAPVGAPMLDYARRASMGAHLREKGQPRETLRHITNHPPPIVNGVGYDPSQRGAEPGQPRVAVTLDNVGVDPSRTLSLSRARGGFLTAAGGAGQGTDDSSSGWVTALAVVGTIVAVGGLGVGGYFLYKHYGGSSQYGGVSSEPIA